MKKPLQREISGAVSNLGCFPALKLKTDRKLLGLETGIIAAPTFRRFRFDVFADLVTDKISNFRLHVGTIPHP